MKALLVKALFSTSDFLGRTFIYNTFNPKVGRFIKNLNYADDNPEKQSLDVLIPEKEAPLPILIYTHGGGWLSGNKKNYRRICRDFAHRGYLVFNINYRLAPKNPFPVPLQDVARAIQWIYQNAPRFGGDLSNIFLGGDSAGAHLLSLYTEAAIDHDFREKLSIPWVVPGDCLKGLLLFYGAFDLLLSGHSQFPFAKTMCHSFLGNPPEVPGLDRLVSPVYHLKKELPPLFICASEADHLHPQTLTMVSECEKIGVETQLLFFTKREHPWTNHSFLNFYFQPCAKIAMHKAVDFMNHCIKRPAPKVNNTLNHRQSF